MNTLSKLHLAVALDGAGWHRAAWRETEARPLELFTPRYWTDVAQEAEWASRVRPSRRSIPWIWWDMG